MVISTAVLQLELYGFSHMSSMVKEAITELSASSNVTAIDASKMLPDIAVDEYQAVDLMFAYTGEVLSMFSGPTLDWTN